jgi:hypothetical protein
VALREPVAPCLGLRPLVLDLEDARNRLLFEPLPRVAPVSACGLSELRSCSSAVVHERPVEAQAITYVDA